MTEPHRTTLQDVAARAGVGIATVDRVLNERGNVSQRTAERVLEAERALNIRRILPKPHQRTLRIEVLLARAHQLPLIGRLGEAFGAIAQRTDRSVVIHRSPLKTDDPELMAARIRGSGCDGIALYAQEHPAIRAAVDAATRAGKAVVTLTSDLPGTTRLAYAGIDHVAAGRTAGCFLGRMARRPGPVLVLCGSFSVRGHEERIRGFTAALPRHGPGLAVAEIVEGRDDGARSERRLRDAVRRHPDTVGIYNVGGANRAVAAVIRAGPLPAPPLFIGHELTQFTRPMLLDGTMTLAIDQNPEQQARFAVDVFLQHFGHAELAGIGPPYRSFVPFTLYGPENL